MVGIVANNLSEIIKTCEKMQLESLYLFGSGSGKERFNTNSDLDFLYQFKKDQSGFPVSPYDYFDLLFDLEKITGRKVDLVAEEKVRNRFFLERINGEKIKIYGS